MEALVSVATSILGLLAESSNNNNNNNNNGTDLEYLKKDIDQQIQQIQIEHDRKLQEISDKSEEMSRENERNSERNMFIINNQISQIQKNNEELERQRILDNKKHEKNIKKIAKENKLHDERMAKIEKDNEQIKNMLSVQINKFNESKSQTEQLERQSKVKQEELNQKLIDIQRGYQNALEQQNSEILNKKKKSKKLKEENEKRIRDNEIEINEKKKEYDE